MASKFDRNAPLDLVISVVVLALLQTASLLVTPERTPAIVTNLASGVVLGAGRLLITLFVMFRLWQLVKRDGGPARLLLVSIAAIVVGLLYSQAWNLLPSGLTAWSDRAALAVRVAGLVALGLAVFRWNRLGRWVGLVILGYATMVAGSIVIGRVWSLGFPQPLIGWAWLVVLVALLVGLLRMHGGVVPADLEAQL